MPIFRPINFGNSCACLPWIWRQPQWRTSPVSTATPSTGTFWHSASASHERVNRRRPCVVDESYFGPRRVKGKRGRGAGSKTIVFGIYKRNGKVCTEIVPDATKHTLQAILRGGRWPAAASFTRIAGEGAMD